MHRAVARVNKIVGMHKFKGRLWWLEHNISVLTVQKVAGSTLTGYTPDSSLCTPSSEWSLVNGTGGDSSTVLNF